jgi:hypothetical protein
LVAAQPATLEGCVIEFESPGGAKMRIHWKATTPARSRRRRLLRPGNSDFVMRRGCPRVRCRT